MTLGRVMLQRKREKRKERKGRYLFIMLTVSSNIFSIELRAVSILGWSIIFPMASYELFEARIRRGGRGGGGKGQS